MGSSESTPQPQTLQALQDAATAPLTESDKALYEPSGKACCWADAGVYAYRLRQLEIMNHAIKTLAEGTWQDPKTIDFALLHAKVLTYTDVDGQPAENHDWSMVSDDPVWKSYELPISRFKEFELYMVNNIGKPKDQMRADFETYLTLFKRFRDGLMKLLAQGCS